MTTKTKATEAGRQPPLKLYTASDAAAALDCGVTTIYEAAVKLGIGTRTVGGAALIFTADDLAVLRAEKTGKRKTGRPKKTA